MTGRAEKGARCAEATDDPAPPASAGDTTTAISITTPDPADEVRRLRGPIEDLRLVIGTLASVGQLRRRFTDVRGITTEPGEPGEPLDSFGPVSDTTGDAVADAARLGAEFDRLHEHADALWFERQWLTAQIDVARTTLGRARGPSVHRPARRPT